MPVLTKPPTLPSERDTTLAEEGLELLSNRTQQDITFRLEGDTKTLTLSASVVGLLRHILEEMSQGHAVGLVALEAELTLQQAADLLNVSRDFVVKLLDDKVLPYHLVGTQQHVLLKAVLEYREKMLLESDKALQELAYLSQEMGTY